MKMIRIASVIERNKVYILSIIAMLLVSIFVSIYKTQSSDKCEQIKTELQPIMMLVSNHEKLKFIRKHKFGNTTPNIADFMHKTAKKNYAKILSIEKISEKKLGEIKVTKVKITGMFWHDMFIFDFLEQMQNFNPGFLNIEAINIDKLSKRVVYKPMLKLELVCEIFQKL